jgi:glycosyltransferase involved in cell wall biosynthesis
MAADLGWRSMRVLGFKNQTELPALYDLCDLFVLPSSYEPWGLVVNEVMNVGRPVIVSDRVGCWPDLVKSEVNGGIFPAGDAQALAGVMATVLADRERMLRMGEASRSLIGKWSFDEDLAGIRTALARLKPKQRA